MTTFVRGPSSSGESMRHLLVLVSLTLLRAALWSSHPICRALAGGWEPRRPEQGPRRGPHRSAVLVVLTRAVVARAANHTIPAVLAAVLAAITAATVGAPAV